MSKNKLIKATDFVPGRVYSVIYISDVDMVQKREENESINHALTLLGVQGILPDDKGRIVNPLYDCSVTVRRVSTVQAAGNETWNNYKAKNEMDTVSTREPWYEVSNANDCIVVHKKNGTEYLRGLPRGITKEEYFIGGTPATDAQVETIRAFKKNNGGESDFVVLNLEKLQNVAPLP